MKKIITGVGGAVGALLLGTGIVFAVAGDLLGTIALPGNGSCSVAGTFDGKYYMTINTNGCVGTTIGVYQPPVGGNGAAVSISSKNIVDAANTPVFISALAWDPSRNKVWGAYSDRLYLIDVGDPTQNTDAVATFQFNAGAGGISLVDGLAYDGSDDSLYYSPDVNCNVYHFSIAGVLLNTVTPKDANGTADCRVSGVVVGSDNTLYIGRDGAAEIRRVHKTTGDFISQFTTTSGRVEDLTCDPVTYAPNEAILAKDAYSGLYEAFEVEPGTCPLPEPQDENPPEATCVETVNPHGTNVPPAGSTTLPGARGGQNEDGFYELVATDDSGAVTIWVTDASGSGPFGPFNPGDKVKITEAHGSTAESKKMGSSNGQADAIAAHITLIGDAVIQATDAAGNKTEVSCLVPPPPK